MNVFVLDNSIGKSVQYHVDKHVVKQVLETAQILSTAVRQVVPDPPDGLYRATHVNHPWAVWARENCSNFWWLVRFGQELAIEYTYRYGKIHKSAAVIDLAREYVTEFPQGKGLPFPHCFPEKYEGCCVVDGYRNYYKGAKHHLFSWTRRDVPLWVKEAKPCE